MEGGKGQQYTHVLFSSGILQDTDPELISPEKGTLLDSKQFVVKDTKSGVVQKMLGDSLYNTPDDDSSSYPAECIGLVHMNGYVIEFWYEEVSGSPAFTAIYMNGVRVAANANLPGNKTHHLDIDGNPEISELYITDGKQVPIILNINSLWDNKLTAIYFEDYDNLQYEINSKVQLNPPALFGLENVGAGGGLRKGSYSYSMRYLNRAGDKTRWSQSTPLIPVPVDYSEEDIAIVPGHRTSGGEASLNPTKFGIKLRIRVANTHGFDFIQLRRHSNNEGTPIDFTPNVNIYTIVSNKDGLVNIKDNPFSVIEFTDNDAREWLLYDEEEVTEMTPIKSAKTIRIIEGRIVLGGVEYESRVLPDEDVFLNYLSGKPAFPIKKKLDAGYHKLENQVYHKSNRLGEIYGYGVKLIDNQGNATYTIPLKIDGKNYIKFPERREAIPAAEEDFSKDPTQTADVSDTVTKVYEVFDQGTTKKKSPSHLFNIKTSSTYNPLTPTGRDIGAQASRPARRVHSYDEDDESESSGAGEQHTPQRRSMGSYVRRSKSFSVESTPSTIIMPSNRSNSGGKRGGAQSGGGRRVNEGGGDTSSGGDNFFPAPSTNFGNNGRRYQGAHSIINQEVRTIAGNRGDLYSPDNFDPSIKATGLNIKGLDTSKLPNWIQGFSIVRSKPAGRVVCQGLGIYSLRESIGNEPLNKYTNRLWLYSPELDSVIGDKPTVVDDMMSNPENYSIQLVSPIAFNSEVYSGTEEGFSTDVVSYANLLKPHSDSMPMDNATDVGDRSGNGHVMFGLWRNSGKPGNHFVHGHEDFKDYTFNIVRAATPDIKNKEGRSEYLDILLDDNVYSTESMGEINGNPDNASARNFHEPFYIVNIIRKGASISEDNVNTYQDIGHYQAINNLVGIGSGEDNQSVEIVSERSEDFMPSYPLSALLDDELDDKSIFVDDKRWLCVNYRDSVTVQGYVDDIDLNGYVTVNGVNYYGLYEIDQEGNFELDIAQPTRAEINFTLKQTSPDDSPYGMFRLTTADATYFVVYEGSGEGEELIDYSDTHWSVSPYTLKTLILLPKDRTIIVSDPTDHTEVGQAIADFLPCINLGDSLGVHLRAPHDNYSYFSVEPLHSAWETYIDTTSSVQYSEGGYTVDHKEPSFKFIRRIVFPYQVPALGDEIRIKYDNRIPLSVFLGDTFIGQDTFVPIDCSVPRGIEGQEHIDNHFGMRAPMPYQYYKRSTMYDLKGAEIYKIKYLRQWAITSILESTVNLSMVYRNFFPYRYYVMRPYTWETFESDVTSESILETEDIHVEYDIDYPDEYLSWERGGIHFPQGSNFDYQKRLKGVSITRAKTGIDEIVKFDKRLHWGMQRNPALRLEGAMKAFPPFNIYDLKNNTASKISILYSSYSDKGDNLYAITDKGVSLLLINKRVLSGADGEQIALTAEGTFITQEIRLNNYIGCPDEKWRGKTEGKVRTADNLSIPVLVFPSHDDMILLQGNTLSEFGTNYRATLQDAVRSIDSGGNYSQLLASGIDEKRNQLLVQIDDKLHMFSFTVNNWLGYHNLNYSKIIYGDRFFAASEADNRMLVEEADNGTFDSISGTGSYITYVVNPGIGNSYEFVDMFLSASHIPDQISASITPEFTDTGNAVIGSIQTYAPGFYYIRFPKTSGNKVLIGKNLYIKISYNDDDQLYVLKYAKIGYKKIVGG